MQIIGFIVQGDRTSHGGVVFGCKARRSIDQVTVARLGDKVWCPRCKRITQIITSRFPQVTDDGIPCAFDMDMTDCGAQIYSRHNDHVGYGIDGDSAPLTKSRTGAKSRDKTSKVQEHFVLHESETGGALSGMAYTLNLADGRAIDGVTDEEGRTSVAWSSAPDDLSVTVHPQPEKSDDPYHFPEPGREEN